MSILNNVQLGLIVLASIFIVFLVISLGWFLIWKAFLSKFRLVRELLGQTNDSDTANNISDQRTSKTTAKSKKIRKD